MNNYKLLKPYIEENIKLKNMLEMLFSAYSNDRTLIKEQYEKISNFINEYKQEK